MNFARSIYGICLCGLIFVGCIPQLGRSADIRERQTYLYCNVYVSTACFGISQGDTLRMTLPADFVVYDVSLAGGAVAVVYDGYNPKIDDADLIEEFEKCRESKKDCKIYKNNGNIIEAVFVTNEGEGVMHAIVRNVTAKNNAVSEEFIENFRPCKRAKSSLLCQDESLFQSK